MCAFPPDRFQLHLPLIIKWFNTQHTHTHNKTILFSAGAPFITSSTLLCVSCISSGEYFKPFFYYFCFFLFLSPRFASWFFIVFKSSLPTPHRYHILYWLFLWYSSLLSRYNPSPPPLALFILCASFLSLIHGSCNKRAIAIFWNWVASFPSFYR